PEVGRGILLEQAEEDLRHDAAADLAEVLAVRLHEGLAQDVVPERGRATAARKLKVRVAQDVRTHVRGHVLAGRQQEASTARQVAEDQRGHAARDLGRKGEERVRELRVDPPRLLSLGTARAVYLEEAGPLDGPERREDPEAAEVAERVV